MESSTLNLIFDRNHRIEENNWVAFQYSSTSDHLCTKFNTLSEILEILCLRGSQFIPLECAAKYLVTRRQI